MAKGLKVSRVFTKKGQNVFDSFKFELRKSSIRNPDGSVVFEQNDVEVPSFWSQTATDILAQKYFKRAKVPECDSNGVPKKGAPANGRERSIKQACWLLEGLGRTGRHV